MELLVALVALTLFAVLALRFGADSRPGYPTEERTLAGRGVTWPPSGPAGA